MDASATGHPLRANALGEPQAGVAVQSAPARAFGAGMPGLRATLEPRVSTGLGKPRAGLSDHRFDLRQALQRVIAIHRTASSYALADYGLRAVWRGHR